MLEFRTTIKKAGKCLECIYFYIGVNINENFCELKMPKEYIGKGCEKFLGSQGFNEETIGGVQNDTRSTFKV